MSTTTTTTSTEGGRGGGGDAAARSAAVTAMSSSEDQDQGGYFRSYEDVKVHEVMLRDWARNSAYKTFFEENAHLVRDKVVMDVGAGTGILSLFAASVGARKVYAVEASNTARLCQEVVDANGFGDRVTVIHSRVEDIVTLGEEVGGGVEEKVVDVIVSEWMGFYLLHESMLDSVIAARDKFLADDGIMVPSAASILLAPVDLGDFLADKLDFWSNVAGFDLSPAAPHALKQLMQEPQTMVLERGQVQAEPQVLKQFDLRTVTLEQVQALSQTLTFRFDHPTPTHTHTSTSVHGFAIWFDVDFKQGEQLKLDSSNVGGTASKHESTTTTKITTTAAAAKSLSNSGGDSSSSSPSSSAAERKEKSTVYKLAAKKEGGGEMLLGDDDDVSVLSTAPSKPPTHWKQTVIVLPRTLTPDPSEPVHCKVSLTQSAENKRHYNIELEMVDDDDDDDDDDIDDDDDDEEEHPVPCQCARAKCRLIATIMEKYGEEHDDLNAEAELVDLTAPVEAADAIDDEMGEGE